MVIQFILIVAALLALSRVVLQFRKHDITIREFFSWTVFWILVLLVVAYPEIASRVADFFGVGRGADVVVYLSLLLVFYLLFRLFVRIEKIEHDITKVVRAIALHDKEKKE